MAILPVIFLVVRNKIVQRESVVAIDVVHGLEGMIRMLATIRKQIVTPINATHQVWDHAPVTSDKTTDIVTIACVPLQPGRSRKSASELITTDIPRLCDQS